MTRRLVLLRHAESLPSRADGNGDHGRLLTARGCKDARQVAHAMQKILSPSPLPSLVICSDATRAKQTLALMAEESEDIRRSKHHFEASIYVGAALDGRTRTLLTELVSEKANSDVESVLCIGHNKGWEEAASEFCGKEIKLHAGSFAILEESSSHESWKDALEDVPWNLVDLIHPSLKAQ